MTGLSVFFTQMHVGEVRGGSRKGFGKQVVPGHMMLSQGMLTELETRLKITPIIESNPFV